MSDPADRVHRTLRSGGHTVATAESLTGGRLAALLTGVPGASETYVGGVVAYASEVKARLLGVDDDVVKRYGVVSAECARAMATGARTLLGTTYALATTGVAGPAEQEGKPAGTVFVGLAGPGFAEAVALELSGKRAQIQDRTCREALVAFEAVLQREETRLG